MTETATTGAQARRALIRRRGLIILGVAVVVGVLLWGLYWLFYASKFESTDDAYVGGDVVAITSREEGTVLALYADDTERVRRGQLLIELDPARANVAMQSAEADLARAVRTVRAQFSKSDELRAQLAAAEVQLQQAESDYRRRIGASGDGAVSAEEVAHAHDAVKAARAALGVAQHGLAEAQAAVDGTQIDTNPDVLAAMARLRDAAITLDHMRLIAPVGGIVAQRTVQLGQQVAAGTPLMAVVPLDDVWVDANFKEGQLAHLRIGQQASVEADIYGGGVTFHGRVVGLGAGSGSAFALLPPQNASGNWVKIVQRVPVRIALDPSQLREHPLRVGLSVSVSVDTRDQSGSPVASSARLRTTRTTPGDESVAKAEQLIARIVAQNSGPGAGAP